MSCCYSRKHSVRINKQNTDGGSTSFALSFSLPGRRRSLLLYIYKKLCYVYYYYYNSHRVVVVVFRRGGLMRDCHYTSGPLFYIYTRRTTAKGPSSLYWYGNTYSKTLPSRILIYNMLYYALCVHYIYIYYIGIWHTPFYNAAAGCI